MLIFIDKRSNNTAKQNLKKFGEVCEFETSGIVYDSISCHPDIFMCDINGKLIVAPNIPLVYLDLLKKHNLLYIIGKKSVSQLYPNTCFYNAFCSEKYLIHNLKYTEPEIKNEFKNGIQINVNQGYCRCNIIQIGNTIITSDGGIFKTLLNYTSDIIYIDPTQIELKGVKNGFFGGCCGVFENKLFVNGSISKLKEKKQIKNILKQNDFELIELHQGNLFDGGGILILKDKMDMSAFDG